MFSKICKSLFQSKKSKKQSKAQAQERLSNIDVKDCDDYNSSFDTGEEKELLALENVSSGAIRKNRTDDYHRTVIKAAKKLSEGKQDLEKPAFKDDNQHRVDGMKDESKKMMPKETHALFMLEEEYHRRAAGSSGWNWTL